MTISPYRVFGSFAKKIGIGLGVVVGYWVWAYYICPFFFKNWTDSLFTNHKYATYAHPWLTLTTGFLWLLGLAITVSLLVVIGVGLYELYKSEEQRILKNDSKKIREAIK